MSEDRGAAVRVGRRSIEVSNPRKVLWPEDRITKADLVDYYRRAAAAMLPEVNGRLLTMERYPNGIDGKRFYQKDIADYIPEWIDRRTVPKGGGGEVTYVVANGPAALVYLANQACITPHLTLDRVSALGRPDEMILDLDPSTDDFDRVRRTALYLRGLLEEIGLFCVVKTTGSRGMHVIVPLDRKEPFAQVRPFAREIASYMSSERPDELTIESRKAARADRIFVDWLRNSAGATAVAPFAPRALPGAPVAMPLDWSEVEDPRLSPRKYSISDALDVIEGGRDPWKGWRRHARSLREPMRRLDRLTRGH